MTVHRPDGRFSVDIRTFCVKSLVIEGTEVEHSEVGEVLDRLPNEYDSGTTELPREVGTVSMKDTGERRWRCRRRGRRTALSYYRMHETTMLIGLFN